MTVIAKRGLSRQAAGPVTEQKMPKPRYPPVTFLLRLLHLQQKSEALGIRPSFASAPPPNLHPESQAHGTMLCFDYFNQWLLFSFLSIYCSFSW